MSNIRDLQGKIVDSSQKVEELRKSFAKDSSSGDNGDMSDDWKKSVDDRLKTLHEDMRLTWKASLGGFAVVVGLIIGLYAWNGVKFDRIEDKFDKIDTRFAALEAKISGLDGKMDVLIAIQKKK